MSFLHSTSVQEKQQKINEIRQQQLESSVFSTSESYDSTSKTTNDDSFHMHEFDSVLIGLSPSHFHYNALNRAFRILYQQYSTKSTIMSNKHRLLCFHRSPYLKDVDGLLSLGPGGFISCLEDTMIASCSHLNKENFSAHVLGKPSIGFYQAAIEHLVSRSSFRDERAQDTDADSGMSLCHEYTNVVMIGDDYNNDVIGALNARVGFQILVQTGKYQIGDELKYCDHPRYDSSVTITLPSIVEAVDHILAVNGQQDTSN